MPRFDRERADRLVPIPGSPPSLINLPSGCPFHPRCRYEELTGGLAEPSGPSCARRGRAPRRLPSPVDERRRIFDEEIGPKL